MNRKFKVLHVFEVVFEFLLCFDQVFSTSRHRFFQRRVFACTFFFRYTLQCSPSARSFDRDLLWSSDSGNDIFSLCVDQIFTVKYIFSGSGISRKCNSGSRSFTHISEYHCLYVYGSSPFFGDLVHATIIDGPFVHPTIEYGTNSSP